MLTLLKIMVLKVLNAFGAFKMAFIHSLYFGITYHTVFLLKEEMEFGLFNTQYWVLEVGIYGSIANGLFSFILLLDNWKRKSAGEIAPMNSYHLRLLVVKPFVAGIACVMLYAVWSVFFKEKEFFGLSMTGEESEILVGIVAGLFAEYWLNAQFMSELFKKFKTKKIDSNG